MKVSLTQAGVKHINSHAVTTHIAHQACNIIRSSCGHAFLCFLANVHAFIHICTIDIYPVHCWKVVLKADSTSWGQYFLEKMVPQGFLHCAAM